MADNRKYVAIKPTTLSAPTAIGATSITPTTIKDREGNSITSMSASFGTKGYFVISPGKDKEEHGTFTGISGGQLTGVAHVTMSAPYTETSGLNEAHAVGEVVVIYSNTPGFYNDFANKENDETVAGTWTFTNPPTLPTPVANTDGANKAYVDGVAIAGASNANTTTKGIVEQATAAEATAGTATGGTGAVLFVDPATLAAQIQSGSWVSATEDGSGSDDTYTASLTPALTAYTANMLVAVKLTVANTGACTLNLNSLGAKAIKKYASGAKADVETGDIVANMTCLFYYDGTDMVLLNPTAAMPTTAIISEMATFFGATDITGAEAETLTNGSDAASLHNHGVAILSATRAANTASGTQTIAHGLGRTPKYIEVTVTLYDGQAATQPYAVSSHGYSNGTTHRCVYTGSDSNGGGANIPTAGVSTTECVYIDHADAAGTDALQVATASFDSTNVTLSWTRTGTGVANNMNILIVAH